jgi:adsorption protein A
LNRGTITDEVRIRKTVVKLCLAAAAIYMRHQQPQAAQRHWRRAAELDPQDRDSRESLAQWLIHEGQLAEAVPVCQELCDLDAGNPHQRMRLGILLAQTRQLDESAAVFRQVIEIAPDSAAGYAALAEVQMLPGRDGAEALRLTRKAVALEPSAQHHYLLAMAQRNTGDLQSARASLAEAMRLNPAESEYRAAYARLSHEPR